MTTFILNDGPYDARGVSEENMIDGVVKSNMATLAQWVNESAKVLVF